MIERATKLYPFARGRSRISQRLSRLRPVKDGSMVIIDDNLEIELRSNDTVSQQLYWFAGFELPETAFLTRTLEPGMSTFDIGAHIGAHTLVMAKRVGARGKVFAFEPEQTNHHLLDRNVRRNGFADRVITSQTALADADRDANLVPAGGSGNWLRFEGGALPTTRSIRCTTVDAFVLEQRIARVDLIKTDTEGAEPLVLKGAEVALDEFRPVLLVEFASRFLSRYGSTPQQLLDLLHRRGYSPFRLGMRAIRPLNQDDDISNTNLVFIPTERA